MPTGRAGTDPLSPRSDIPTGPLSSYQRSPQKNLAVFIDGREIQEPPPAWLPDTGFQVEADDWAEVEDTGNGVRINSWIGEQEEAACPSDAPCSSCLFLVATAA